MKTSYPKLLLFCAGLAAAQTTTAAANTVGATSTAVAASTDGTTLATSTPVAATPSTTVLTGVDGSLTTSTETALSPSATDVPSSDPSVSVVETTSTTPTPTPTPSTPPPTSTTPATATTLPASVDASSYMSYAFRRTTPAWATGQYFTLLASALYAVDKSWVERTDYHNITSAIYSAGAAAGAQPSASLASSAFGWGAVTTNGWYSSAVPQPFRSAVGQYNGNWRAAETGVQKQATTSAASGGFGHVVGMLLTVFVAAAASV